MFLISSWFYYIYLSYFYLCLLIRILANKDSLDVNDDNLRWAFVNKIKKSIWQINLTINDIIKISYLGLP